MRIIAGEFRSRRIAAPHGSETRPTSDRLRETLFNVLAPRLPNARFLDLYAGSGANGLEALSRSAREAVFVEQGRPALTALRANIASLGVADRCRVEGVRAAAFLKAQARGGGAGFDVIFLDPPYEDAEAYTDTLGTIGREPGTYLAAGGVVVAEHRRPARGGAFTLSPRYGALERMRELAQGDALLSFYEVMAETPGD
jgi:16S rRNA (guanine966-N2)-methyltransferase